MEKLRSCTLGAVREEMKKEDEELAVKIENQKRKERRIRSDKSKQLKNKNYSTK